MSLSSRDSSSSGLKIAIEREAPPPSALPALVDGGGSGGSPIPPPRFGSKRSSSERDDVPAGGGGGGLVSCEICGAEFLNIRGVFGHMKNHKNRGWKGIHPPPTFDIAEFAEYQHLLVKPLEQQEAEEKEEVAGGRATATEQPQAAATAAEAGGRRSVTVPELNNPAEGKAYLLPDLNLPYTGPL